MQILHYMVKIINTNKYTLSTKGEGIGGENNSKSIRSDAPQRAFGAA